MMILFHILLTYLSIGFVFTVFMAIVKRRFYNLSESETNRILELKRQQYKIDPSLDYNALIKENARHQWASLLVAFFGWPIYVFMFFYLRK